MRYSVNASRDLEAASDLEQNGLLDSDSDSEDETKFPSKPKELSLYDYMANTTPMASPVQSPFTEHEPVLATVREEMENLHIQSDDDFGSKGDCKY